MRILIVAAHPDDETLGCAGIATRLALEGNELFVAVLGEGATARGEDHAAAVDGLRSCLYRACALMGAKEVFTYDLPDNLFDTIPLLDIVKLIEELTFQIRPEVVFTHHGGDLNIDHVLVHRATVTATRPFGQTPVSTVYAYEVPSSTEWSFGCTNQSFASNVFFDISSTIETKLAALACYPGECRSFPHPRSPEAIRAIATRWGSVAGFKAAEAFELVRTCK